MFKKMFNKKFFLVCIVLLGVLFTTGCVDGQVDIKINGDGSGDLSYAMIIDKSSYDPEILQDYIEKLEDNLFVIEQRDMGEIIIINASVYLPKFRTIFDPTVVLENEAGRIPVEFKKNWLRTEYDFDFDYNIEQAQEVIMEYYDLPEASFNTMAFSVTLPSEALEHNSDEVKENENMYTWKINKEGTTKINLKTRTVNIISLIVTIGIPLFAGIAIYKDKKKSKKLNKK